MPRVDVGGGLKQFNIHFWGRKPNYDQSHDVTASHKARSMQSQTFRQKRERERSGKLFKVLHGARKQGEVSEKKPNF